MARDPLADSAGRLVAETELALKANAASKDFDASMESISRNARATPEEMEKFSAQIMEMAAEQSSWRRHPLRRFNAKRQWTQILLGEYLLERFPFIRRPAEWLNRTLEQFAR